METDKIICGDCLGVMEDFPDNSVDLVVTSPPYDSIRQYHGYSWHCGQTAQEMLRVIKDGGIVVWIVKDGVENGSETGTSFRQALDFMGFGWRLHDTMIYAKKGVNYPRQTRYHDSFEYMFVFSKGAPKTVNLIRDKVNTTAGDSSSGHCRNDDDSQRLRSETFSEPITEMGVRQNIWLYNTGFNHSTKDPIAFKHPAIFPEALAFDHIRSWSNEGDLVLDPMCGSGTTCKMAKILDRHYIGIDISEKYCEIARKRVEAAEKGITVKELEKGQGVLF